MRMPPYDDEPDWRDSLEMILGTLLVAAVLVLAWWMATDTGVARHQP